MYVYSDVWNELWVGVPLRAARGRLDLHAADLDGVAGLGPEQEPLAAVAAMLAGFAGGLVGSQCAQNVDRSDGHRAEAGLLLRAPDRRFAPMR